jgi:hypothetical protein
MQIPTEMDATAGIAPISNLDIIRSMADAFDVPIRRGRFQGQALGIYKVNPEVVRLKAQLGGDLGIATHEIAHHVDKTLKLRKSWPAPLKAELALLDYDQTQKRPYEGFAEFVRHYLTDDQAQTLAPKFYDYFTNDFLPKHPDLQSSFGESRSMIDRWRQQGAVERVKANISDTGVAERPEGVSRARWYGDKIGDAISNAYANMKDEGYFLKLFEREAKARGYKPAPGSSPSELAEAFTQAGPTLAERAVEDGPFAISRDNFNTKIGPSLKEALQQIKPQEYDDWRAWIYARHALEALKTGKNPGISAEDAQYLYDKFKGNPVWEKAAQQVTEFNNGLISMLENADVIDSDTATKIIKSYETYVPLLRERQGEPMPGGLGGKRLLNLGSPLRGRKGSALKVIDPIQSSIERAVRFYTRAIQQQVLNEVVTIAEKTPGMGGWMERIPPSMERVEIPFERVAKQLEQMGIDPNEIKGVDPSEVLFMYRPDYTPPGGKPIARVTVGKQRAMYEFDPNLYKAISGMNYFQLPWYLDLLFGKITRLVKTGATGLSIGFGARNPIRDYGTYLFQSKAPVGAKFAVGPMEMVGSYIYSHVQKVLGKTGDPVVRLWEEMAGPLTKSLGLDRKQIRTKVSDLMATDTQRRALNIMRHPFDALREVIGVTEVGPRLAEFKSVLEKHGYTREKLHMGATPPRDVLVEGKNASANVTVNFSRMGYIGKWINQMIPFFNASLEGPMQMARTIRDRPSRTAAWAAAAAAATVGYWLTKKDEGWYKSAPPWLKYGFWTVSDKDGNPVARFPRPYEWGWIVSSGTEAILNAVEQKNPGEMSAYAKEAADMMSPSLIPAALRPGLEDYFNKDIFRGQPIETRSDLKSAPEQRFDAKTLGTSKAIGSALGISPKRLEHLLEGYTGGMYAGVVRPIEKLASGKMTAKDIPGIRAFSVPQPPAFLRQEPQFNTPAMKVLKDAARDSFGGGAMTEERRAQYEARDKITETVRSAPNKEAQQKVVNQAFTRGEISKSDKSNILKDARQDPLTRAASKATIEAVLDSYAVAGDDEKRLLDKIIKKKLQSKALGEIDARRAAALVDKLNSLSIKPPARLVNRAKKKP